MFYLSVTAVTQGILWSEDLDLFNISKGCAWEEDTEAPTAQWLMGSWCNIFSKQHLDIWKGWQNMWKTNHAGVKTCGKQNIKTMDRSSVMSYAAAPRYMKRLTKHVEDKSCGSQNMWKTKHQNNGSFIRDVLRCRSWSSCCKLPSLTPQRFEGTRKWVGWDEARIMAIAKWP